MQQLALCLLVLVNGHWVPLALNARSMTQYRSSPDGPAITAQLVAEVEADRIVGWREPVFEARDVNDDGSLAYDPREFAAILGAPQYDDAVAEAAGAIGISRRLNERRQERRRSAISPRLQAAAYDRAILQIADRLRGIKTTGVTLVPA